MHVSKLTHHPLLLRLAFDTPSDTKLADRTAAASAIRQQLSTTNPSTSPIPPSRSSTPKDKPAAPPLEIPQSPNDLLLSLRADLTTTQKARSALQTHVSELTSQLTQLNLQSRSSAAQISLLTKQKTDLERRLRDREEEIRGKAELVDRAQDEMVALGLQLNVAEERSGKLERENKELVDRWMKKVGEEAERVNRDSRWE